MKQRDTQTGSAHVVIMGILIVALCAALGIVFYQNFVAPKNNTPTSQTTPTANATTTTAQVAFDSALYELEYPTKWSVTKTKIEGPTAIGTAMKIVNPDKTVEVNFTISDSATSDACDVNDGLKVSDYKVYSEPFTKLTDQSLYLVESIYDAMGGGYLYKIGLVPDGGDTHTVVGDSHCNVIHVGNASTLLYAAGTQHIVNPSIQATIDFPKLTDKKNPVVKEMQPIKDQLNSNDYKDAVKVLESMRRK